MGKIAESEQAKGEVASAKQQKALNNQYNTKLNNYFTKKKKLKKIVEKPKSKYRKV